MSTLVEYLGAVKLLIFEPLSPHISESKSISYSSYFNLLIFSNLIFIARRILKNFAFLWIFPNCPNLRFFFFNSGASFEINFQKNSNIFCFFTWLFYLFLRRYARNKIKIDSGLIKKAISCFIWDLNSWLFIFIVF